MHCYSRGQKYKKTGNRQRKLPENLERTKKMSIFATSNFKFDYPGRIPRGSKTSPTLLHL